jgi:hypothetical protein
MPDDLMCPLTKSCQVYEKYLLSFNEDNENIIRGAVDGYCCRALYRVNSDNKKNKECALIKLLNNTDSLLKLNAKGTL